MLTRRQRKLFRKIVFTILAVTIVLVGSVVFYQWLTFRKTTFVRYPEFGIPVPINYAIHGIDVSKYQEDIDWKEVQEMNVASIQLGFAFIKATEGISNTDPSFTRNWKKAKDNQIIRGAYHFFIASRDGKQQAENFIKKVKLETGDLPPVLDVEQLNGVSAAQLKKEMRSWLQRVETHYKVKPIIYTNVDFYKRNLGSEFDAYPLWAAHYYQLQQPKIDRGWIFWQHSDKGRVNGIVSQVDFNVFNGDSTAFRNILLP